MSILLLAALALQNQKNKYKNSGSKKQIKKSSRKYPSCYEEKISFTECVLQEMEYDNKELEEFFEFIKTEYLKDALTLKKENLEQIKVLKNRIKELIPNYNEFLKIMKEKGIDFSYDSYFMGDMKWLCFWFDEVKLFVNDFTVQDVIKEVDKKAEVCKINMYKLKAEINELKSILKKESLKLKLSIFFRKYRKEYIQDLNKRINEKTNDYSEIDDVLNKYLKFINMSESEKELLAKTLIELKEIVDLEVQIRKLELEISHINDLKYTGFSKNVITRTMERLVQEGKITQETLEKIFCMLDKVEIKARRGEYSDVSSGYGSATTNIVEWFIKNVYEVDPNFVKNNYYLENEEEPQDEPEDGPTLTKKIN